jgi:hypothetical protein
MDSADYVFTLNNKINWKHNQLCRVSLLLLISERQLLLNSKNVFKKKEKLNMPNNFHCNRKQEAYPSFWWCTQKKIKIASVSKKAIKK